MQVIDCACRSLQSVRCEAWLVDLGGGLVSCCGCISGYTRTLSLGILAGEAGRSLDMIDGAAACGNTPCV